MFGRNSREQWLRLVLGAWLQNLPGFVQGEFAVPEPKRRPLSKKHNKGRALDFIGTRSPRRPIVQERHDMQTQLHDHSQWWPV
ncbi:uncharacterized protein B0I36DRAFT_338684 [Microdochium trichocladiopsis]|uniref:Secreted protein n=1 Tax=Microdochium trichocladiopsis TaxID=1682393 RepID=A0A9P8XSI0_9PEZI|nr:uncharacterized protein B0I36DRAFT_338684 [Microdochium trichocladiopsis]KAH7014410.1 hypothetical protein B0I36DRAFT_338684 [Microdochium trichocladiopsis]